MGCTSSKQAIMQNIQNTSNIPETFETFSKADENNNSKPIKPLAKQKNKKVTIKDDPEILPKHWSELILKPNEIQTLNTNGIFFKHTNRSFDDAYNELYANKIPIIITSDPFVHIFGKIYLDHIKEVGTNIIYPKVKSLCWKLCSHITDFSTTSKRLQKLNPMAIEIIDKLRIFMSIPYALLNTTDISKTTIELFDSPNGDKSQSDILNDINNYRPINIDILDTKIKVNTSVFRNRSYLKNNPNNRSYNKFLLTLFWLGNFGFEKSDKNKSIIISAIFAKIFEPFKDEIRELEEILHNFFGISNSHVFEHFLDVFNGAVKIYHKNISQKIGGTFGSAIGAVGELTGDMKVRENTTVAIAGALGKIGTIATNVTTKIKTLVEEEKTDDVEGINILDTINLINWMFRHEKEIINEVMNSANYNRLSIISSISMDNKLLPTQSYSSDTVYNMKSKIIDALECENSEKNNYTQRGAFIELGFHNTEPSPTTNTNNIFNNKLNWKMITGNDGSAIIENTDFWVDFVNSIELLAMSIAEFEGTSKFSYNFTVLRNTVNSIIQSQQNGSTIDVGSFGQIIKLLNNFKNYETKTSTLYIENHECEMCVDTNSVNLMFVIVDGNMYVGPIYHVTNTDTVTL